jgi:hypothetical protein
LTIAWPNSSRDPLRRRDDYTSLLWDLADGLLPAPK